MITKLITRSGQLLSRNSSTLMTAAAVTGVVGTAYLAAKASFKVAKVIEEDLPEEATVRDKVEYAWPYYVPAALSGVATISAVLMSHKIETRKTAAAISAYSLTERAFSQYREKIVDEIGSHKEQVVRDELAKDQIDKDPPTDKNVIFAGSGEVLCCELHTGRYFNSSMESLRRAQNDVNSDIINQLYVTLNSFYDIVGLPYTAHSNELGWDSSDGMLELKFSTVLTEDGKPCLAFDYNYVKPI